MCLTSADWQALWLTVQLALVTTLLLLIISAPLAWWLSRTHSRFRASVEAIIALPLVLPPTVLGFYLLLAMGANGWLGQAYNSITGAQLAFSFTGLVVGSLVYSLPFVVQPLHAAFASVSVARLETAATLGAGRWDRFRSVVLPGIRSGVLSAAVLGFAHTLGEFGVVLMIGGNIEGETRVVSIAIYEHVETLEYARAHAVSLILLVTSFALLMTLYSFNGRKRFLLGSRADS